MKKLVIFVAVIFAGSMLYAQSNTSTSTQTGDENNTEVTQTGLLNVSEIDQDGDYNEALIDQTGEEHYSMVDQTVGSGSNNATADVDQTGKSHESRIKQGWGWHNTVLVDQASASIETGNKSAITQNGTSNFADIYQHGDENILHNSKHGSYDPDYAFQRGAATLYLAQQGYYNDAGVYQDYSNQYGDIYQYGYRNYADLTQTSPITRLGNTASISQTGYHGLGYGKDNWSEIWQIGDFNDAVIDIKGDENGFGTVGDLWTDIYQEGDENSADIIIRGNKNDADISQIGNNNSASTAIGASAYVSDYNEVEMYQEGDGNEASFGLQKGDNNYAEVDQFGDNNYTEYSIKYGSDNTALYDVDGSKNRSRFSVDAVWGSSSDANALSLTQDGVKNYASGEIEGDGNTVDMIQAGDDNRIGTSWYTKDGVDILGDYNTATISQSGAANMSKVSQTGNYNTATVTQAP